MVTKISTVTEHSVFAVVSAWRSHSPGHRSRREDGAGVNGKVTGLSSHFSEVAKLKRACCYEGQFLISACVRRPQQTCGAELLALEE